MLLVSDLACCIQECLGRWCTVWRKECVLAAFAHKVAIPQSSAEYLLGEDFGHTATGDTEIQAAKQVRPS